VIGTKNLIGASLLFSVDRLQPDKHVDVSHRVHHQHKGRKESKQKTDNPESMSHMLHSLDTLINSMSVKSMNHIPCHMTLKYAQIPAARGFRTLSSKELLFNNVGALFSILYLEQLFQLCGGNWRGVRNGFGQQRD